MAEGFKACRDWEKHDSACSLCVHTMTQQNLQQSAPLFFCQVMKTPRGSPGGESHCEQEYITKEHVLFCVLNLFKSSRPNVGLQ